MKTKIVITACIMIVAISVAHARSRLSVFTFTVHPLAGYAGQIQ